MFQVSIESMRNGRHTTDVVGDIPAWIRRMSVQEMAEKNWRVDGEITTPVETPKDGLDPAAKL